MIEIHSAEDTKISFLFVGIMISAVLVGFAICQSCVYFTQYSKDRLFIKILVALTLFCELLHQALISFTLYWYTIANFDQFGVFGWFNWSIIISCVPDGIAITSVQIFFILRIWHFSPRLRPLAIVLLVLSLLQFSLVMVLVGKSLGSRTFADFAAKQAWAITPLSLGAAIDVVIAVVLVTVLHRSRTGIKRTDNMINTLILFAMSTGMVTAMWAIATLISIVVKGVSFITIFFYYILGRLYFNSLLTGLNARQTIYASGCADTISFITARPEERQSTLTVLIHKSVISSGGSALIPESPTSDSLPNDKQTQ